MNPQAFDREFANLYLASPADPQLLQACRAGDQQAWQQLLGKYTWLVCSIPLHCGLPHTDAVDVAQIVFTSLIQSLHTLRDDSNLGNWLKLVARRHTWRVLRCHQHADGTVLNDESMAALFPAHTSKDEVALMALPATMQEILLQRFVDHVQFRQQPNIFQKRRAALTFDSAHQPVSANLRAGGYATARHYIYAIELTDVTLNVQPCWHRNGLDLLGQILPNSASLTANVFAVQLLCHEQEVAITQTDAMGGFWFEAIKPDNYMLLLSADTFEIEIPVFAVMHNQ